jgi:molybdopterin converting factor subunit 1
VIVPEVRPAEMRESIELALNALADDRAIRWVILTPGDCPGITPELVAALLASAARDPDRMIVPVAREKRGHPVVLPRELAVEIPKLPAGTGVNALRSIFTRRVTELALANIDACTDLDTPDDLRAWLAREAPTVESNGEPTTKLSPNRGEPETPDGGSARQITIDVRLFAIAKDKVGQSTVTVELLDGSSVADLRAEIRRRHPELAPLVPRSMIAVDEEYASDDQILANGSRVALIPPVSGGG